MQPYQRAFITHALERGVLRFGEFTLKSGRVSPYFFNTGLFDHGGDLVRLGRAYAAAAAGSGIPFDMLFGPAYKGIPLVAVTAAALAEDHGRDLPFAFNRKEVKDHGEGGRTVGAPLAGRVLVVDDVISAGTSVRESVSIIQEAGAVPAGVVIALDRQERGQGPRSAVAEVEATLGIPVQSIVTLDHLMAFLAEAPDGAERLARIQAYREAYGA